MKKTNGEQANVQVEPEFETQSELMTFHLLKGTAWTEAVPIAKTFSDKREFTKPVTLSLWKGHAKWLVNPARRHSFDLIFDKNALRGQVVHRSGRRPLGQEEIRKLIEELHTKRRVPRGPANTAPFKKEYEPKDYDIGDGSRYVYAYYYPEYRKNGEVDFRIKIGHSSDYHSRINEQHRATGMPEEPEVAVMWRTDNPEAAEKLLHDHLKFRGKHLRDVRGIEWFLTSPDEIRQIIESSQPGVSIRSIQAEEET